MGSFAHKLPAWLGFAACAALLITISACGGGQDRTTLEIAGHDVELPWPPADGSIRMGSDDSILLHGVDYASRGGAVTNLGTTIQMSNSPAISHAIYSVGGFGADVTVGSVLAEFSKLGGSQTLGEGLYWLLANYSTERWDSVLGTPPSENFAFAGDFSDYISPSGFFHIACIHIGSGNSVVGQISITRLGLGATVPAPTNLAASAVFGKVQLTWDAVPFAKGYNIYRDTDGAMDNPVLVNGPTLITPANYDDVSVDPVTDYWYAVTAVRGIPSDEQESAYSNVANITSLDDTLPAPANLAGTGAPGQAHLTWDPVPGAVSYILYRALNPAFTSPVQVPATITDTQYTDTPLANDKMYFYKVKAMASPYISDYSNLAEVSVPASGLEMPTNFHVVAIGGDYVTFAWDYSGAGHDGFYLYISYTENFPLDDRLDRDIINNPAKRSAGYFGLPPNVTAYARLSAFDGSGGGPVTDDVSFTTGSAWTWDLAESIGAGHEPFSVVTVGSEASVAYVDALAIKLATRSAGTWTPGACGMESGTTAGGFDRYLDLAYNGSNYLVAACSADSDDLWVSVGTPGSFTATRIDGDGSTGLLHPVSGEAIRAAASADEYAVVHSTLHDAEDRRDLRLMSRPTSGGSWTNTELVHEVPIFVQHSLSYMGTNLCDVYQDYTSQQMFFGDAAGAWAWQEIAGGGLNNMGSYNDIKPYGAEFITPAYNPNAESMSVMQGIGGSWTTVPVVSGIGGMTRAQIAVLGANEAMMTFYSGANGGHWFCAHFNGTTWSPATITVPGATVGDQLDITNLGSLPLIVFKDGLGSLWASVGIPPA